MAFPLDVLHPARAPAAPLAAPQTLTWAKFTDVAGDFAVNLGLAALILVATVFAAKWASRLVSQGLGRLRFSQHDSTLQQFGSELTRWIVALVGLIAVLQRLGVQTTSIIAVLGAASLAVGLALQGALSNVAAGVLLLILRPYRVGDQVELGTTVGTVRRLDLFHTDLATQDNRKVVVPNAKAVGDVLINRTTYGRRRTELDFNVGYRMDLDQVFKVALDAALAHPKVLKDPPPFCGVTALKDFAVQVTLYAWTAPGDWFQTGLDLRKAVKEAFDRAGVEIPFPVQVGIAAPTDDPSANGVERRLETPVGRA